jgi:hypothetical protein
MLSAGGTAIASSYCPTHNTIPNYILFMNHLVQLYDLAIRHMPKFHLHPQHSSKTISRDIP